MRILSLLSLSILSFIITACCSNTCQTPYDDSEASFREAIHSDELTSIIQDTSVKFHEERHLELQQAKTFYSEGINTVQLEFISQDLIEMDDARELIIDLSEFLLGKLNQNPILAAEFTNYPFTPYNLEIYITYESYYGRFVDPNFIAWICLEDGKIDYYTFRILEQTKKNWTKRRESYATSREIVLYQREAERNYKEENQSGSNVFGSQRYYGGD